MKNPLSIEAFADWCEKQPPEKEYEFISADRCAVGQYAKAMGTFDHYWGGNTSPGVPGPYRELIEYSFYSPHTFGALSKRLREAQ